MLYANNSLGEKIKPGQGEGTCPYCNTTMTPKCGCINKWHWAHKSLQECDVWSEGETEWHLTWKNKFLKEYTEVVIEKEMPLLLTPTFYKSRHIADYYNPNTKLTIEFQHSSLSFGDRLMRQLFYDNLVWVIDLTTLDSVVELYKYDMYRWKHPKKWITTPIYRTENHTSHSLLVCDPPFYLHIPDDTLLEVREIIYVDTSVILKAKKVTIDWFVSMVNRDMVLEYFKAISPYYPHSCDKKPD